MAYPQLNNLNKTCRNYDFKILNDNISKNLYGSSLQFLPKFCIQN